MRESAAKTTGSIARLLAATPDLITSFDCLVPVTTEVMAKSTAFFGDSALHRAVSFCAYDGARLLLEVSFGSPGEHVFWVGDLSETVKSTLAVGFLF